MMIKGTQIKFIGNEYKTRYHLTKGRTYTVLAGLGDGVPRNDGKVGAFIQSELAFAIEDDMHLIRQVAFNEQDWKIISIPEHKEVKHCNLKSPVFIPCRKDVPTAVMGEFNLDDASGSN